MEQKKALFIGIPAMVLFVGYILWDEVLKPSEDEVDKKSNSEQIVFADDEFTQVSVDTTAKPLSTESKVEMLREQYNREKEGVSRKVVSHEDFFGGDEVIADDNLEDIGNDDFVEEEIQTVSKAKPAVTYKPKVSKSVQKKEVVSTVKEAEVEAPVKRRRSRNSDDMFNTGESSAVAIGSDVSKMVEAVVHSDHSINTGQNVLIRLMEDVVVNGVDVEKNTFLTATSRFSGDRVILSVNSINSNGNIIPVDSEIYDAYDNSEGIYVPGGVEREIKDEVVKDVISETGRRINVPLLGTAEIGTKKKVKDPIVNIANGHKLYIKFE